MRKFKDNKLVLGFLLASIGFLVTGAIYNKPSNSGGGDTIWTNLPAVAPVGEVATLQQSSMIQIATNRLAGLWGGDATTVLSIGYGGMDFPAIAATNALVYSIGDAGLLGASVTNCFDIMSFGNFSLQGTIVDSYNISCLSSYSFQGCVITNSYDLLAVGTDAGYGANVRDSSYIALIGDQAGNGSIFDHSQSLLALGRNALGGVAFTNSDDVIVIGKFAGSGMEGSFNHVMLLGSGSIATNDNDFVFGNNAYNYFFPGASMRIEGPVSFGSNIRLGRFDSPGYPSTGQIYHKSDVATGDGNFGDIFFEQFEDESNPLALRTLLDLGRSVDPAFPGIFLQVAMYTNGVAYTANMSADSGRLNLQLTKASTTLTRLSPSAHDYIANTSDVTPYLFDTDTSISAGNILEAKNNGTNKFSVGWDGSIKSGLHATTAAAATIASTGTIAPIAPITFISGTSAIATITAPSPISSTGGQITLIPTGAFTTTTAGNIALASTAVVNKALIMTYDSGTSKWYPSY